MGNIKSKIVDNTKAIVGEVRFSYVHVFEKYAFEGDSEDKAKFSTVILIPKSDTKTIKIIEQAIENAQQDGIDNLPGWKGKLPKTAWNPLQEGEDKFPDDEDMHEYFCLNAKSNTKPGIVDKFRNKIEDSTEFYAGCYGVASIKFFPYFHNAKATGVGVLLNNLMKTRDGEPLAGKASAESDFDEFFEEDEMDDLL